MEGDDENAINPPPVSLTPQASHTISTIKLPIMKKGEYDIWAMKMKHYLAHTDYPIWEVIQKRNGPVQVSTDTNGQIRVLPPKTAEEILARKRERKARTTLLMVIPEDHLKKIHKITDVKEMWEAIKSRFGGNDEFNKMQKYILKQKFEGFYVSNSEGLHKGYDMFQSLLSQLEIHGAGVSTEDANQKFLRSLPSSWFQVFLILKTKPGVDALSFDDLYNNLRVFESDIKGYTASSSNTQNVAFVSSDNTNSTNEISTAYDVSTSSGHNSQKKALPHTLMISCTLSLLINPVDTLLESTYQKEIKKVEGEMHEILDTKQKTMGRDLQNSMNVKLCNSGSDTEKPKRAKDAAYHSEKMLLCKQEEAGMNADQADWKDDTDDESDDQELEAHYMYMAKIQQVSPNVVDSGPIFDKEPEQKVQNDDQYDVFAIECQHPEQSGSVHKTYLIEQDAHKVLIESENMNYDSEQIDQNDEDADLAEERSRSR
nr:ribonuclease H-like domain-containing protein [Tanacetum cinerariifolium]